MTENNTLDEPEVDRRKSLFLKELILWWEKKRPYYNITLLIVIAYVFYEMWYKVEEIGLINSMGIALYFLFGANLFYALGWIPSALVHLITKYDDANIFGRWTLFILGTLFSILWMLMILQNALFFGKLF